MKPKLTDERYWEEKGRLAAIKAIKKIKEEFKRDFDNRDKTGELIWQKQ